MFSIPCTCFILLIHSPRKKTWQQFLWERKLIKWQSAVLGHSTFCYTYSTEKRTWQKFLWGRILIKWQSAGSRPQHFLSHLQHKDTIAINSFAGSEATVKMRNSGSITWKVISSHEPFSVIPDMEHSEYGMKRFRCENYKKSEIMCFVFLRLLLQNFETKGWKDECRIAAPKRKCRPFTLKNK